MLSQLSQAMIVNGVVWGAVLATDLGPARKVGTMRIVRPLVVAAVIVPLFVAKPDMHGTSLVLEIAGIVAGVLCGLAAVALMRVYRSPETSKPVSRAGWGYAALWTAVIGARAAFSYGCVHWWPTQLVHWGIAHRVGVNALTDALVFMAVTMLVTRTLGIWARAASLAGAANDEPAGAAIGAQR
ncbi:MAG TPA: hypothetical protein VKB59_21500 [Micromonosporaceae bacterium]|nr:hypothetical protein [Micromonosporaceae bacterium]